MSLLPRGQRVADCARVPRLAKLAPALGEGSMIIKTGYLRGTVPGTIPSLGSRGVRADSLIFCWPGPYHRLLISHFSQRSPRAAHPDLFGSLIGQVDHSLLSAGQVLFEVVNLIQVPLQVPIHLSFQQHLSWE